MRMVHLVHLVVIVSVPGVVILLPILNQCLLHFGVRFAPIRSYPPTRPPPTKQSALGVPSICCAAGVSCWNLGRLYADMTSAAHLMEDEQGQSKTGSPDHWAIHRRCWNCRAFRTELRFRRRLRNRKMSSSETVLDALTRITRFLQRDQALSIAVLSIAWSIAARRRSMACVMWQSAEHGRHGAPATRARRRQKIFDVIMTSLGYVSRKRQFFVWMHESVFLRRSLLFLKVFFVMDCCCCF